MGRSLCLLAKVSFSSALPSCFKKLAWISHKDWTIQLPSLPSPMDLTVNKPFQTCQLSEAMGFPRLHSCCLGRCLFLSWTAGRNSHTHLPGLPGSQGSQQPMQREACSCRGQYPTRGHTSAPSGTFWFRSSCLKLPPEMWMPYCSDTLEDTGETGIAAMITDGMIGYQRGEVSGGRVWSCLRTKANI